MRWFFPLFIILEIVVTVQVGSSMGGLNFLLEVLLSGIIGMLVIMNFKSVLMQSMAAVMSKQMSLQSLVRGNLLGFIGAILLVIPGILTDIIGTVFLLAFTKNIFFPKAVEEEEVHYKKENKGDEDVIDVEIIEYISDSK